MKSPFKRMVLVSNFFVVAWMCVWMSSIRCKLSLCVGM